MKGFEGRIFALVSFALGKAAPSSLIATLQRAKADHSVGDIAKSAMRLALAFPTPATDEEACRKLHIAVGLMDQGYLSPRELLWLAKIDDEHQGIIKYSQDQPRVSAGNSDGGQWTRENSGTPSDQLGGARMADGCADEWKIAFETCERLLAMQNPPRGLTGGHLTVSGCAKGFVSMRCGGNSV
jgi:hypothetical protein